MPELAKRKKFANIGIFILLSFLSPKIWAAADLSLNPEAGELYETFGGGLATAGSISAGYLGIGANLGFKNRDSSFAVLLTGEYLGFSGSTLTETDWIYGLALKFSALKLGGGLSQSNLNYSGINGLSGQGYWGSIAFVRQLSRRFFLELGFRYIGTTFKASSNSALQVDSTSSKYIAFAELPFEFFSRPK